MTRMKGIMTRMKGMNGMVVFFLFLHVFIAHTLNFRPIIGIVDQPVDDDLKQFGSRQFSADYVKWLEAAGARVVPINYLASKNDLIKIMDSINGVLFTGGGIEDFQNNPFWITAQIVYNYVIERNSKGDYFPLWGTCQGFQVLCMLTANNLSVVTRFAFDSENLPLSLDFTNVAPSSRLFGSLSADLYSIFATQNVTINLHHDGVYPSLFQTNPQLASFYNLLSTNVDRKGVPFASSMEGKKFPIYAVQFHPERNQFEWDLPEKTPHDFDAVRAVQALANFFVQEVRRNSHSFSSPTDEKKALIYNYSPIYNVNSTDAYPEEQIYVFE